MSFFLFFSVFSSIVLGWTYGVSIFIIKLFPILSRYLALEISLSLLGTLCFIIGITGANSYPSRFFTLLYQIGSIWLGAITLAGLIAVVYLLGAIFFGITYTHIAYLISFIVLVFGVNIWGLYASFSPIVKTYTITLPGNHTWHGKNIIMIADTHYGNIYDENDARKLVHQINSLSGEIVLIPGDFFDGPKIDFVKVANEFRNVQAPYGVIFSNGNHEEYRNTDEILSALTGANITILNNKKETINGLTFAGVTYHTTETESGLVATLEVLNLEKDTPTILLKHKPTFHKIIETYPINLVVSGHTHHGQIWPFSLITDVIYGKYAYGFYKDNSLYSITTSGVGTW